MLTLLVDVGNTRTKWRAVDVAAGFAGGDPSGALLHADVASLSRQWQQLAVGDAWIVSVAAPAALAGVRRMLLEAHPAIDVSVLAARTEQCGVINTYTRPERLGADRWAMLIAARALYPRANVLIASLGTATTIDLLREDGHFQGGVILPGIGLMRETLARNTAGLPLARGRYAPFARNTDDAIISGILHAQAGAIQRLAREAGLAAAFRPEDEGAASPNAHCLLAGGDAPAIQPLLPFFSVIADNLVLRGLLEVARESSNARAKT